MTSGDDAVGIGASGEILVFSINIASTGSTLVILAHCHAHTFDEGIVLLVLGNSGIDTHPTVSPGPDEDGAHDGDAACVCAVTADGGIYDHGWLGSDDHHRVLFTVGS